MGMMRRRRKRTEEIESWDLDRAVYIDWKILYNEIRSALSLGLT